MNENPVASDWIASRGEKWRAQLTGMEAMMKPVNQPLIDALDLGVPCKIADIGCGGGGTTREILDRAPAGSVVHGFDISPALIESARGHIQPNERALDFEIADMATTPAPEEPYDRLVSRFGVMFFDDPPAAFANLARWLAPGGRFAFAVWGRPAENLWFTSVREIVAKTINMPKPDPEAPGPFRYGDTGKLHTLLDRAGFAEVDVQDWRGTLPIGGGLSASDAAKFALASFSSFGELLAEAGDKAVNDAHQALTARFSREQQSGSVRMDACVHIFTGTRRKNT